MPVYTHCTHSCDDYGEGIADLIGVSPAFEPDGDLK